MGRIFTLFAAVSFTVTNLVSAAPFAKIPENGEIIKRSETYHGTATYFVPADQGGNTGACGPYEDSSSDIVALNAEQYGSMTDVSDWCGKTIKIKGPKGTVTATINDACPECGYGSLDLTPVLFKQVVGDASIGEGSISWTVV